MKSTKTLTDGRVITTDFHCEDCGKPIWQPIRPALCLCTACVDKRWPETDEQSCEGS